MRAENWMKAGCVALYAFWLKVKGNINSMCECDSNTAPHFFK